MNIYKNFNSTSRYKSSKRVNKINQLWNIPTRLSKTLVRVLYYYVTVFENYFFIFP